MILRRLAALLLALALLAGWQEALEHPLQHASSGLAQSDDPVCAQHGALDALLGAIGCARPSPAERAPAAERVASFVSAPASPALLNPSSRDPPSRL
jgi:hypothetical protein